MRYKKYRLLLICLCLPVLLSEASFTKKRSESVNMLREQCGTQLDEMLAQIPQVLRISADFQEISTHMIRECIQGEKKAWLLSASKEQLLELRTLLKEMRASAEAYITLQGEKITHIKSLYRDVCKGT